MRNIFKNVAVAILASCAVVSVGTQYALADNWVRVGQTKKGTIDLDSESVQKQGDFVDFRARVNLPQPYQGVKVFAFRYVMSCSSGAIATTSIAGFNQHGRMIGVKNYGTNAPISQAPRLLQNAFCSAPPSSSDQAFQREMMLRQQQYEYELTRTMMENQARAYQNSAESINRALEAGLNASH